MGVRLTSVADGRRVPTAGPADCLDRPTGHGQRCLQLVDLAAARSALPAVRDPDVRHPLAGRWPERLGLVRVAIAALLDREPLGRRRGPAPRVNLGRHHVAVMASQVGHPGWASHRGVVQDRRSPAMTTAQPASPGSGEQCPLPERGAGRDPAARRAESSPSRRQHRKQDRAGAAASARESRPAPQDACGGRGRRVRLRRPSPEGWPRASAHRHGRMRCSELGRRDRPRLPVGCRGTSSRTDEPVQQAARPAQPAETGCRRLSRQKRQDSVHGLGRRGAALGLVAGMPARRPERPEQPLGSPHAAPTTAADCDDRGLRVRLGVAERTRVTGGERNRHPDTPRRRLGRPVGQRHHRVSSHRLHRRGGRSADTEEGRWWWGRPSWTGRGRRWRRLALRPSHGVTSSGPEFGSD